VGANIRFHLLLGEMSRNQELATIARRLLERMTRVLYMQATEKRAGNVTDLHGEIIRAVRDRDPERARDAVVRDIVFGQSALFAAGYPIASVNGHPGAASPLS
jgi:DNA-binding GntR family transcriptional regulator